jgi:hypothetical protein
MLVGGLLQLPRESFEDVYRQVGGLVLTGCTRGFWTGRPKFRLYFLPCQGVKVYGCEQQEIGFDGPNVPVTLPGLVRGLQQGACGSSPLHWVVAPGLADSRFAPAPRPRSTPARLPLKAVAYFATLTANLRLHGMLNPGA